MGHWTDGVLWVALVSAVAVTGCHNEGEPSEMQADHEALPEPEPMHSLCDVEMTQTEIEDFLRGDLVVAGAIHEDGSSGSMALADLALTMVGNGIDMRSIHSARPSFSDGRYSLTTGESSVSFQLFFAEDFEQWSAGDPIPYNMWDSSSYATNVALEIDTSQFPPKANVTYEPGPLAGLVEGEIDVDPISLGVRVQLRTDLIDIESVSILERAWDDFNVMGRLHLKMATSRFNLEAMADDLQDAGVGYSLDGTNYRALFYGIDQDFYDSQFLARRMDDGNYVWEGGYEATLQKFALTLYQSGFASTAGGNYVEYYCDEERTVLLGTAEYDDGLESGMFAFGNGEFLEVWLD